MQGNLHCMWLEHTNAQGSYTNCANEDKRYFSLNNFQLAWKPHPVVYLRLANVYVSSRRRRIPLVLIIKPPRHVHRALQNLKQHYSRASTISPCEFKQSCELHRCLLLLPVLSANSFWRFNIAVWSVIIQCKLNLGFSIYL